MAERSRWSLPAGVEPGTWDYVHSDSIARDYDAYFRDHPLLRLDREWVARWLPLPDAVSAEGAVVADFGCGTGRSLLPLLRPGVRGLAVDLSALMLEQVADKARTLGVDVLRVQANLVELEGLATASIDHALCLFSTLGMVKGRAARRRGLGHFARLLKPGGTLMLHVHNLWANAKFPGGVRWLVATAWRSRWSRDFEWGDKYYAYRGLADMYLHTFRFGELRRDLNAAGFRIAEVAPLSDDASRVLADGWWNRTWHAGGWLVRAIHERP